MIRTSFNASMLAAVLFAGIGCQTMTDPEKARVIANPTTPVVKTMTSFSGALRCMDDLFADYGKRDITITSDGIPDETGKVQLGTKEIMISTISKMSAKSNAFRFVDVEQSGDMIFWMNNKLGTEALLTPDYYVRGSITQADTGIATDSQGAGIGLPFLSLGYSQDQMLALVSMDLNMGVTRTRRILPGLHTSNTITIMRSGQSGDAEGLIGKGSVYLEVAQDQSQGTHQAVRTLLELSLIETLGKFTKVPYWRCLQLDSTNPAVIDQARDWYDQFTPEERIRVIQQALAATKDYAGPVDGRMTPALQQAVNRYKSREDLIADGRIDFDMYLSLLAENVAIAPTEGALSDEDQSAALQPLSNTPAATVDPASAPAQASIMPRLPDAGVDPIGLSIRPVGEAEDAVRVGEEISFRISVRKPADVYCYYEGYGQPATRIFPSRFQPDGRVNPGAPVTVPPTDGSFSIIPDAETVEQIACIAVADPYGPAEEPALLAEGDLTPLSAKHLFRVVNQHLEADQDNSSIQHLRYQVRPVALTN